MAREHVDFGQNDPRCFSKPGDPDLIFDLTNVLLTAVVVHDNVDGTIELIVGFMAQHGVYREADELHSGYNMAGEIRCEYQLGPGEAPPSVADDGSDPFSACLLEWMYLETELRLTASPDRMPLLIVGPEEWEAFPPDSQVFLKVWS